MPKCEMCPHWKRKTTEGSMGWCAIHQVARRINDSCSQGEIERGDMWWNDQMIEGGGSPT